jgi:hypothetical protein
MQPIIMQTPIGVINELVVVNNLVIVCRAEVYSRINWMTLAIIYACFLVSVICFL